MKSKISSVHHGLRSRQRGFGMALALAVLAVFAVIAGVISFANRSGSASSGNESGKGMAQAVVSRGNEIYSAALRGQQDRPIGQMLLAATSVAGTSWGLFDPALGLGLTVTSSARKDPPPEMNLGGTN